MRDRVPFTICLMHTYVPTETCNVQVDIWFKCKISSCHSTLCSHLPTQVILPEACNLSDEIVLRQQFLTLSTSRLIHAHLVRFERDARKSQGEDYEQLHLEHLAELVFLVNQSERNKETLNLTMSDVEAILRLLRDAPLQVASPDVVASMRRVLVLAA